MKEGRIGEWGKALTMALAGCESSASCSDCFGYPLSAPWTLWVGCD